MAGKVIAVKVFEPKVAATAAREIRRIVLEQSKRAHVGHIGSALSVADILAVIYSRLLRVSDPDDGDRDRMVLSKGHAALALYAALHLRGWLSETDLNTYCANDGLLGVHPDVALRGVDFTTGSLGHGLAYAAGAALAARLDDSSRRVYALLSDAECNEGAVWESALFAAHHKLTNLIAVVDVNGQQALGKTAQVLSLDPLREKWAAFGWDAIEVDGHNHAALEAALTPGTKGPRVVLANTTFGKGVSFMQSRVEWHYLPMSDSQFASAISEVLGSA